MTNNGLTLVEATIVLVHNVAWWTELANGLVVFDNAWSVSGTSVAIAWVDTLEVVARLIARAATVL